MNNILRADLHRLFKSKPIYYGFVLSFILPIVFNLTALDQKMLGTTTEIGTVFFIPILISSIIGLTIISDFSGGGVKNKIIMGNRRLYIYLSWMISFTIVVLAFLGIYEMCYFGSAKILGFNMSNVKPNIVIVNIIVIFFLLITSFTFSLMICFMVPDGRCLILLFLVLQIPMVICEILSALYPDNKILDLIFRLVPQFQAEILNITIMPNKPWLTILCNLCFAIVMSLLGIKLFSKKDLK